MIGQSVSKIGPRCRATAQKEVIRIETFFVVIFLIQFRIISSF